MVVGEIIVIGTVPMLTACCYNWQPCKGTQDIIEETTTEMTQLREFVLQPLPVENYTRSAATLSPLFDKDMVNVHEPPFMTTLQNDGDEDVILSKPVVGEPV